METRERLQEDHTQSNSLNGVQDTKPEPERNAEIRSRRSSPGNVQAERRGTPQHLAPSWCTKPDREDGEEPGVCFAEMSDDEHHNSPHEDEEGDDEDKDLPLVNGGVPQE